ncbi:hypothetical protein ACU4GD_00565 [Cupriavidus basilensis]
MKFLIGLGFGLICSVGMAQEPGELMGYASKGSVPPGYAPAYAETVKAAEDEGRLVIYSTTDAGIAEIPDCGFPGHVSAYRHHL